MQEFDPRRFRSDAAFNAQLVRVLRKLDKGNASVYFNGNDGKNHRVHVELAPKASRYMSSLICPALGPVGLTVAHLERQKLEGGQKAKEAFHAEMAKMRA